MIYEEIESIITSLLNLKISDIENIDCTNQMIIVTLSKSKIACPYCLNKNLKSKGFYKRKISLPSSVFKTYTVILRVRRYYCDKCFKTFSDPKNLAPANKKISYETTFKVMEMLKSQRVTFKDAAQVNNISESTVVRIFDEHCHIPRRKFPEVMCIDEVYTKINDFDSKYSCLFYDFHNNKLIDVVPSRKKNYLDYYLSRIDIRERNQVKYVCIDMYKTYKYIVRRYFKKAIICVDSFHVVKTLNDSFENIRIRTMKRYDSSSNEYYLLKHFNYLLKERNLNLDTQARFNHKLQRYVNLRDIFMMILKIDEKLELTYYLKETYMDFNRNCSYEEVEEKFDDIYQLFLESDIEKYYPFIAALKHWRYEIINSFIVHNGRRINNGVAESINAKVSQLIYNTKGISNNRRRRKRILYTVNREGFILK